jgi:hypothetical protein
MKELRNLLISLSKEVCLNICSKEHDYDVCQKCNFNRILNEILGELNGK